MKLLHTLLAIVIIFLPTAVQAIPVYFINPDILRPKMLSNHYFFNAIKTPSLAIYTPPYLKHKKQQNDTSDLFTFNTPTPEKKPILSPPKKTIRKQENFIKILAAGIISMKLLGSKSAN
ncbi:hypothetical protein [Spartinivicinus poritis]|uniref:Uncharacterized protein n=1 Tax=Spartinivicinus poritis TaxID=2994640 RepID=A0ABT5UAZ0_9GAMM|nr:hypothetical protein [Spartinivicinus sp. A2-2]MDE1463141.1 hypothetical protein [Spartinivicinus sp. A2-2]